MVGYAQSREPTLPRIELRLVTLLLRRVKIFVGWVETQLLALMLGHDPAYVGNSRYQVTQAQRHFREGGNPVK